MCIFVYYVLFLACDDDRPENTHHLWPCQPIRAGHQCACNWHQPHRQQMGRRPSGHRHHRNRHRSDIWQTGVHRNACTPCHAIAIAIDRSIDWNWSEHAPQPVSGNAPLRRSRTRQHISNIYNIYAANVALHLSLALARDRTCRRRRMRTEIAVCVLLLLFFYFYYLCIPKMLLYVVLLRRRNKSPSKHHNCWWSDWTKRLMLLKHQHAQGSNRMPRCRLFICGTRQDPDHAVE